MQKLKPSWPVPRTDRKDPYAIRSALLLVLIVAMLAAGSDRWGRIASAFAPATQTSTALLRLDAWVTPPVYTGIAPIVLADGSEPVGAGAETFRALSVPERSDLLVRVFSPGGETVSLETQPDDGTEPKLITPKSTGTQGLKEFNVALTAPYMHQGQYATLAEVIEHYSTLQDAVQIGHHREKILVPLNLTAEQAADLEAFLHTLTSPALPPEMLVKPGSPILPTER